MENIINTNFSVGLTFWLNMDAGSLLAEAATVQSYELALYDMRKLRNHLQAQKLELTQETLRNVLTVVTIVLGIFVGVSFVYLALTAAEIAVLEFIGWCCQRAVELVPIINAQ